MHSRAQFLNFCVWVLTSAFFASFGACNAYAQVPRTEVHPIQTMTLTDQQFLTGAKDGKATTIAGVLSIPTRGPRAGELIGIRTERLPAVILMHGSGGVGSNVDYWSQQLNEIGIATFVVDYFTGRGIRETASDQAQLGRFAGLLDSYRALEVLAANPRIDPNRIAVMGFSRGGFAALYAALTRFQSSYAPEGQSFAAYVAFYVGCNRRLIDDETVANKPIRLFHGTADDYDLVAPCRAYVERLRKAGKDAQLAEYAGAHHVFDDPLLTETPLALPTALTSRRCTLVEVSPGRIVNAETRQPFTLADPCLERGPHLAYNPTALNAATKAVKEFFQTTFKLN